MPQELVRRVLDLGNTPVPERYPGYRRGTLDLSGECGQVSSSFLLKSARYFVRFLPWGPEVSRGFHHSFRRICQHRAVLRKTARNREFFLFTH
jgi:hypothetical protein